MEIYTVYCLYSIQYDKIYIGRTSNLIKRFHSHNKLSHKGWTIRYRPWIVAYAEYFESKQVSAIREKELKSAKGRNFIWKYIKRNYN